MSIRSLYNNDVFPQDFSTHASLQNLIHIIFQEPVQLINNVKALLALQADHQGRPYQPDGSPDQKHQHIASQKSDERGCNNLNVDDEDYDHLNYTRTVNELSPNYIKLNNEK